jgi:hypothetical protein
MFKMFVVEKDFGQGFWTWEQVFETKEDAIAYIEAMDPRWVSHRLTIYERKEVIQTYGK